jgi:hypothetical protein
LQVKVSKARHATSGIDNLKRFANIRSLIVTREGSIKWLMTKLIELVHWLLPAFP